MTSSSSRMSITSAIISLKSMNPSLNLSEKDAKHIYVDICSQDMQKSIQHILNLTKNTKNPENENKEDDEEEQPNTKISKMSDLDNFDMKVIDRMGKNLAKYALPKYRTYEEWSKPVLTQIMNDSARLKLEIIKDDAHIDHEIYWYMVKTYFNNNECDAYSCASMKNNRRDRMKPVSNYGKMNTFDILDAIHVSILHGYDTGHKLYQNERTALDKMSQKVNDTCVDLEAKHIRSMISSRTERHKQEMTDMRSETQAKLGSKFVTIVAKTEENESESECKNNNQPSKPKASGGGGTSAIYRFGYKFYYHKKFQDRDQPDWYYNGGSFNYSDWYIPIKYPSMKEEVLKCFELEVYNEESASADAWLRTKYCRELVCKNYQGTDYEIEKNSKATKPHMLVLLFHCNLTAFCTKFSCTFRKLREHETDDTLRARNRELREFSRLLVECIHCFGTPMCYSKISSFYSGVSIIMQFPSTYGQFCSPTSTTTALSVALSFGKKGIVLELINHQSAFLSYFDCSIISVFSNESEKLFFQSGIMDNKSAFVHISLAFKSIRVLELNHNYEFYVVTISCLQQMIQGDVAYNNTLRLRKKHVLHLQRLMDPNARIDIPAYILNMFDSLIDNTTKICLSMQYLNVKMHKFNSYFRIFRKIFCELYSKNEIEENRAKWGKQWVTKKDQWGHSKGFVQPVFAIKVDVLFKLFPNANTIEIEQLPLTHRLMQSILNLELWKSMEMKRRLEIKVEVRAEDLRYSNQSDFTGKEKYNDCIIHYYKMFAENGLRMRIIQDKFQVKIGLEIKLKVEKKYEWLTSMNFTSYKLHYRNAKNGKETDEQPVDKKSIAPFWTSYIDAKTGQIYFHDTVNEETIWGREMCEFTNDVGTWKGVLDEKSGYYDYHNLSTQEVTRDVPKCFAENVKDVLWLRHFSPEDAKYFYEDKKTGAVTWDKPDGIDFDHS